MNGVDIVWILVVMVLVLFMMLLGFVLFYGGLVWVCNVFSVFMYCFVIVCLMSVLWLIVGYLIVFGGDGVYWGGLGKMFLNGVDVDIVLGILFEVLFFVF